LKKKAFCLGTSVFDTPGAPNFYDDVHDNSQLNSEIIIPNKKKNTDFVHPQVLVDVIAQINKSGSVTKEDVINFNQKFQKQSVAIDLSGVSSELKMSCLDVCLKQLHEMI